MPREGRRKSRTRATLITGWLQFVEKFVEFLLFPSFCQLCGRFLERRRERVVCHQCWERIILPPKGHCLRCGRFYEAESTALLCLDCLRKPPYFEIHRSAFPYEGVLREIILLFKFKNYSYLARPLAEQTLKQLGDETGLWDELELLLPVPLHPRREKERGYNQAQLLAQIIGEHLGLKCEFRVLQRFVNSPPQSLLEGKKRWDNVKNAFKVRSTEKVKDKIVGLVDDIYTTGATLNECSRVLLEAGVREVRAITTARA